MRWILILLLFFAGEAANAARVDETRALMGTAVQVSAEGRDEARLRAALGAAFAEMTRLSAMMSHYESSSVVSEIGRAAGRHPVAVPPELLEVLRRAQAVSRDTQGAFDATIGAISWRYRPDDPHLPSAAAIGRERALVDYRRLALDERKRTAYLDRAGMRLDLGGIAKLYILQAGLRRLEGVSERALVNGGGDVAAWSAPGAAPWRVGIRDPRTPDTLLGSLPLARGFVVSSGDYERSFVRDGVRYSHILDPRTGRPAGGPRGVTLASPHLEDVAGYGVAIMVLGVEEAKRLVRERPQLDALVAEQDGALWMSAGMGKRLRAR